MVFRIAALGWRMEKEEGFPSRDGNPGCGHREIQDGEEVGLRSSRGVENCV